MPMRAMIFSLGFAAGLSQALAYAPAPSSPNRNVPHPVIAATPMVFRCNLQPPEHAATALGNGQTDFRQFSMRLGPGICLIASGEAEPDGLPDLPDPPPLGPMTFASKPGRSGSGPAPQGSVSWGSFRSAGGGSGGGGVGGGSSPPPGSLLGLPYTERKSGSLPGGVHSNPIPGRTMPVPVPGPITGAGLPVLVAAAACAAWRRARSRRGWREPV